jgi:hypothetical protein
MMAMRLSPDVLGLTEATSNDGLAPVGACEKMGIAIAATPRPTGRSSFVSLNISPSPYTIEMPV